MIKRKISFKDKKKLLVFEDHHHIFWTNLICLMGSSIYTIIIIIIVIMVQFQPSFKFKIKGLICSRIMNTKFIRVLLYNAVLLCFLIGFYHGWIIYLFLYLNDYIKIVNSLFRGFFRILITMYVTNDVDDVAIFVFY